MYKKKAVFFYLVLICLLFNIIPLNSAYGQKSVKVATASTTARALSTATVVTASTSTTATTASTTASTEATSSTATITNTVNPGIERTELYFNLLKGKKVGLVGNITSILGRGEGQTHLVDSLIASNINLVRIFSPEHGFRGQAEAGAKVAGSIDPQTGIKIISLYGANKKPLLTDIKDLDVLLFDLQDVGIRFFTYISTLHYVMEACAEAGVPLLVLDRPNPHIMGIDGPVLDTNYRSFVGMHPVPIIYGLTIGEYAVMINSESWLKNSVKCDLTIVPIANYSRKTIYNLPISPSPNLQSFTSICAYPSLCLFEGTPVSLGRGTDDPFTCYGFDGSTEGNYIFTPISLPGKSLHPPLENKICTGYRVRCSSSGFSDFSEFSDGMPMYKLENKQEYIERNDSSAIFVKLGSINLEPILRMYRVYPNKEVFFSSFFKKLVGNTILEKQIRAGFNASQIKASWQTDLEAFKKMSSKYYIYTDIVTSPALYCNKID